MGRERGRIPVVSQFETSTEVNVVVTDFVNVWDGFREILEDQEEHEEWVLKYGEFWFGLEVVFLLIKQLSTVVVAISCMKQLWWFMLEFLNEM